MNHTTTNVFDPVSTSTNQPDAALLGRIEDAEAPYDPYALIRGAVVGLILSAMMVAQIVIIVKTGFGLDCWLALAFFLSTVWFVYQCCPDPEYRNQMG